MFVVLLVEFSGVEDGEKKVLRRSNRKSVAENQGKIDKFLSEREYLTVCLKLSHVECLNLYN